MEDSVSGNDLGLVTAFGGISPPGQVITTTIPEDRRHGRGVERQEGAGISEGVGAINEDVSVPVEDLMGRNSLHKLGLSLEVVGSVKENLEGCVGLCNSSLVNSKRCL